MPFVIEGGRSFLLTLSGPQVNSSSPPHPPGNAHLRTCGLVCWALKEAVLAGAGGGDYKSEVTLLPVTSSTQVSNVNSLPGQNPDLRATAATETFLWMEV